MKEPNHHRSFHCVNGMCSNEFIANMVINEDGMNTFGYWIVKCEKCGEIFKVYIGRDVRDSSLIYGGEILGIYDDDVYGDIEVKNQVLKFKEDEARKLVFHKPHLRTNKPPLKRR